MKAFGVLTAFGVSSAEAAGRYRSRKGKRGASSHPEAAQTARDLSDTLAVTQLLCVIDYTV